MTFYIETAGSGDTQTSGVALSESAAEVEADWAALVADDEISSLTLTDSGTPVLDLTAAQVSSGAALLGKIANTLFEVRTDDDVTYYAQGQATYGSPTLSASGIDVDLAAHATMWLEGGYDSIRAGAGAGLTISQTNGDWDAVYATDASVSLGDQIDGAYYATPVQAAVVGGGDSVNLLTNDDTVSLLNTGGAWDTVNGSSGEVVLDSAQASLLGGGDLVFLAGAGDALSLHNTGADWDTVYGSNAEIILDSASASLVGIDDVVYGAAGDTLSLYNHAEGWDTVYGDDMQIGLTAANVSVIGGGDVFWSTDGVGGGIVSLYDTKGAWDTFFGSSTELILTDAQVSVDGFDVTVYAQTPDDIVSLYGGTNVVVGSGAEIILTRASAAVSGEDDTIWFNGAGDVATTGRQTFAFVPAFGRDLIEDFFANDILVLPKTDFADWAALAPAIAQQGTDTTITLDADDVITLRNTTAANLTAAQFQFV